MRRPGEILQCPAQHRGIDQLVLPGRRHHHRRPGRDATRQEAQQPDAHLIGPVQVLEDQEQRPRPAEARQELSHALEDFEIVGRPGIGAAGIQLGQQARQLASAGRGEVRESADLLRDAPGAKRIHPRAEGQDLLAFVTPPEQDVALPVGGFRGQLADQPGLADPRLAQHQHELAASFICLDERGAAARHFQLPSDEGDIGRHRQRSSEGAGRRAAHRRPPAAWRTRAGSPAEDLLVDLARVGLGLDAELAPEDADAELVLPEGAPTSAELGVEAHQGPVDGFLERIEGDEPERGLERGFRQPG